MFFFRDKCVKKKSNAKRQKRFCEDWLEQDEFKSWLRKVDEDGSKFKCCICKKTLYLSSAGKSAVTEHGKGGTHQQLIKERVHFSKPNGETEKKQTKLDDTSHHVTEMAKTKALVVWLLKSIDSGFSNNSSDDIVECLQVMCPDSKIASSLKMKRTKAYYVINHGLAPYFKTLLLEDVSASDICVLSFDESLNDVLQKCDGDSDSLVV